MFYFFSSEELPAEKLYDYQWPQRQRNAEWFMVQEQVSEFLGVLSFKRKYPGKIFRMEFRQFCQD